MANRPGKMMSEDRLGVLWKCIALAVFTCLTLPAFAQDTPVSAASLRDEALELLADIDTDDLAVRVRLILEAQAILARIETEFPESDEAILLLLDGSVGTLSKSDLAARLETTLAEIESAVPVADPAAKGAASSEPPAPSLTEEDTAKVSDSTTVPVTVTDAAADLATSEGVVAEPEKSAPERDILKQAVTLNLGLESMPPETRAATLVQIRDLLDQIVDEHPESDLALEIILKMPIDGIDPAEIDRKLAALAVPPPAPVTSPPIAPPPDVPPPEVPAPEVPAPVADLASETLLALDRQAWRDVQARLLVLGFDPNGIDGQPGQGTRRALSEWQSGFGLPSSGFLASEHLSRLIQQSQGALDIWLQVPENLALHTPPPPLLLTSRNVGGNWDFTATCGKNSSFPGQTITGVLSIDLVGARSITGTIRNSQGMNGRVSGRLDDRRMSGEINWGLLLGRVSFSGQIASQSLNFSGSDSNGCRLRARKA